MLHLVEARTCTCYTDDAETGGDQVPPPPLEATVVRDRGHDAAWAASSVVSVEYPRVMAPS